jgi:hypothetical protein
LETFFIRSVPAHPPRVRGSSTGPPGKGGWAYCSGSGAGGSAEPAGRIADHDQHDDDHSRDHVPETLVFEVHWLTPRAPDPEQPELARRVPWACARREH